MTEDIGSEYWESMFEKPIKKASNVYNLCKRFEPKMPKDIGSEYWEMMTSTGRHPVFEHYPGSYVIRCTWEVPFYNGVIGFSISTITLPEYEIALLGKKSLVYDGTLGYDDVIRTDSISGIFTELVRVIKALCKEQAEAEVVAQ